MTVLAIGAVIGVLYGTFGAGGSAFATPLLALAGVPAVVAIASPLPATIPAALAGAWSYRRHGDVADAYLRRSIVAGVPAAFAGAVSSALVSGRVLLALSGLLLVVIGLRLLTAAAVSMPRPRAVLPATIVVGFSAGLLANSGGFLLVPVFVLLAGLGMRQAAGTSLVVAAALSVPTLVTHWALGHVDWWVAAVFAAGLVPGTLAGVRVARAIPPERTQRVFGLVLVAFAGWFLTRL